MKTKILIPSRPRTDYSIELTNEKHTCKILTCNSHTKNPITPVTNGTPSNYSILQDSNTVDVHDPKNITIPILHKNSTVCVDNTLITSNRRHHPPRINIIPWIVNIVQSTSISIFSAIKRRDLK